MYIFFIYNKKAMKVYVYDENGKEIPNHREQRERELSLQYIRPEDIILELGGRYGSVSCPVNLKLNNRKNHVVVEPDDSMWSTLEKNRDINKCGFHIVKGLISKDKYSLVAGGYGTTAKEYKEGEKMVPNYSLNDIIKKYGLKFTALIVDCEGCFEKFFDENYTFVMNLRMVFFELDCTERTNYAKIKNELKKKFIEVVNENNSYPAYSVWIKSENYVKFTHDFSGVI